MLIVMRYMLCGIADVVWNSGFTVVLYIKPTFGTTYIHLIYTHSALTTIPLNNIHFILLYLQSKHN